MKPQRPVEAIVLTAFLGSGQIQGSPGDRIEVTDENRDAVKQLIEDRGCRVVYADAKTSGILTTTTTTAVSENDNDNDTDDGLSDVLDGAEAVDVLSEHKIAARYIAALKEAKLLTIADVRNCTSLAATPGLNEKVAAKILEAVAVDET